MLVLCTDNLSPVGSDVEVHAVATRIDTEECNGSVTMTYIIAAGGGGWEEW